MEVSAPTAVLPMEPLFCQHMPLWKRAMDVVGAIVGLVLVSPVLLAAAVAVKGTSPRSGLLQANADGRRR